MPRLHAVLDIGSNSTSCGLYAAEGSRIEERSRENLPFRLIRKLDVRGALPPGTIDATARACAAMVRHARESGADSLDIVATSAVRDATNRDEVVAAIESACAEPVRLLSGGDEGQLAAEIVMRCHGLRDGAVVDLGGGSMQVVRLVHGREAGIASVRLGALRVTGEFFTSDPPPLERLSALRRHAVGTLRADTSLPGAHSLVAVGGAARCLARVMRKGKDRARLQGNNGASLPGTDAVALDDLIDCGDRLARLDLDGRASIPGIRDSRAESITAAVVVLLAALRVAGLETMHVSPYGIREALAARALLGA